MLKLGSKFKKGIISEEFRGLYLKENDLSKLPLDLWWKCSKCSNISFAKSNVHNMHICPKCGYYFRMDIESRKAMVIDEGSFEEWGADIKGGNPLDFKNYEKKLSQVQNKFGIKEAVEIGKGKINGFDAVVGICDSRFLMGSMGYAVGEKIAAAFEKATEQNLPVIIFCCSGGARMQEGIVSLMQMAKISASIKKHSDAGLLYIPVLTDPTTGGVTASFAMLGDIILAEPDALIGFAGPRVIEQTIGCKLPPGFQRSEFLLENGMIDGIVDRKNLKRTLSSILEMHSQSNSEFALPGIKGVLSCDEEEKKAENIQMSAWDRVLTARMMGRPTSLDYINHIFTGFIEMHGDRLFADDNSIVGGIAYLETLPVTVIGIQKGKDAADNSKRNWGMPLPEGYHKALRLMKQAEKFHRPIINFIDTPGAFCGIEAEERGQGRAIANNLLEMSAIKSPILSIIIGEGGSGGALALAVGNEVWMMENAIYSILSPEGFASILWKDSSRAKEAADVMKITAKDLKNLNIIDRVIEESCPADKENLPDIAENMREYILEFLHRYGTCSGEALAELRYKRFRNL